MYHDKPSLSSSTLVFRALCILVSSVLVLVAAFAVLSHTQKDLKRNGAQALKQTVVQSALQCYAVEGSYPPSLAYLEENYGLQINHKRYVVTYDVFASNILPQITVLQTH